MRIYKITAIKHQCVYYIVFIIFLFYKLVNMFSGIVYIFCCFIIKLYKICCFNLNSLQKLYNYLQKQNIFDRYNNDK